MSGSPPRASAEELVDLARKYATLLAWRRAHAERGVVAEAAELRGLARAFPGALRELDTVPLDVIAARAVALAAAAEAGAAQPWMDWMVAYHSVMRTALWLKLRLARTRVRDRAAVGERDRGADVAALLAAAPPCKIALDAAFVHAVARPPLGRLNSVVFGELGRAFSRDPDAIWEELFPARRSHRLSPAPRGQPAAPATAATPAPRVRPAAPATPATLPATGERRMIQFYGSPSSSAGKTHWLLEELAIPYVYHVVNRRQAGADRARFLAKNPSGKVPFIEDGDVKLFESMAINLYLAEKYGPTLLPSDVAGRALVYQWSFWAISNLQPLLLDAMFHAFLLPEHERNQEALARSRAAALPYLEQLSNALSGNSYLVGDTFGVADINAGAVVNLSASAGIALDPFPHANAWLARLRERPAYRKAAAAG